MKKKVLSLAAIICLLSMVTCEIPAYAAAISDGLKIGNDAEIEQMGRRQRRRNEFIGGLILGLIIADTVDNNRYYRRRYAPPPPPPPPYRRYHRHRCTF